MDRGCGALVGQSLDPTCSTYTHACAISSRNRQPPNKRQTKQDERDGRTGPAGGTEGIDWDELAAKIRGGTVGGLGKYALGVFLNNEVRVFLLRRERGKGGGVDCCSYLFW
jgi:hypothetical protein